MRPRSLVLTLTLAACGGSTPDMTPPPPPDLGPRSGFDEAAATAARASCAFKAGDLPGLSLAKDAPLGSQIPIDTIVVLMMENRSFDHMLADLKRAGQPDADVADTAAWTNPDKDGKPVGMYREPDYCFGDTNHSWGGSHREYNDGKNDGFVVANQGNKDDPVGRRAMSYYTADDLPTTYFLANTYAVADRYFCSLLGPTYPNREFLYAATSYGRTFNELLTDEKLPSPTIFDTLARGGVSWSVYSTTVPGAGALVGNFAPYLNTNFNRLSVFWDDAAAGNLPHVVFLDPDLNTNHGAEQDGLHPPGDVQLGDLFFNKVIDALTRSPQWPHMAVFITFDEHGGLADHVPPPPACAPDDLPIKQKPGDEFDAKFDRLGFRVPLLAISPYAKAHHVGHKVYDHTSILRFIEARFVLPALTRRDANADPLFDLFDFGKPALLTPPPLPAPKVDMAKLEACKARYPKQ